MKKQLILILCASTLGGAAFGELPDKKQKNPGRTAERQDQSHDVHELEKISFTVIGEGLGSPPGVTYLKIKVDPNEHEYGDDAVLRLICAGGELRNAALWTVTGADASGKRTHHPVTFVKEWGASHPQFRTLSESYLKRKLSRTARSSGGWQPVEVVGASGLCPSSRSAPPQR